MNIELTNETENEVEFVEQNNTNTRKSFRKYELLVFLGCLLFAFIIWCYANYLEDPIIQKEVTVRFVLTNAEDGEVITDSTEQVMIYGERSSLATVSVITVYVERSMFSKYDEPTMIPIEYPEHIHSHVTGIELQLKNNKK